MNRQTIVKLILCVNLPPITVTEALSHEFCKAFLLNLWGRASLTPITVTGKTHDKTALVKFRVESPKKDAQFSVESKDAQFSKVKSSEDMEDRLLGFPHDTTKRFEP